jgi:dUTP pyrophosphatase
MKTSKVKKITSNIKQTYDITVSNNHNFFCNNHLIHNCGYTGEIKVIIFNTTKNEVKIEKGQKIAQGVVSPVVSGKWINLVKVDSVEDKDRSNNGFGSTGI